MGDRAGDNSQVLGLGEALGWPLVEKHFVFQPWEKLVNLPWGAHLLGVSAVERNSKEGNQREGANSHGFILWHRGHTVLPIPRWPRKPVFMREGAS